MAYLPAQAPASESNKSWQCSTIVTQHKTGTQDDWTHAR